MHNLQMAVKEIVSHKNLHLNVVPLEAQLRASCNNWMKLLHFISTAICPAIWMTVLDTFDPVCILFELSHHPCLRTSKLKATLKIRKCKNVCKKQKIVIAIKDGPLLLLRYLQMP